MTGRVSYPIRDVGGVSTGPSEGVASILDTLRVGTVMLDGNGRILLWNPMTEEILGWRAEEVVGRRIQDFLRTVTTRGSADATKPSSVNAAGGAP